MKQNKIKKPRNSKKKASDFNRIIDSMFAEHYSKYLKEEDNN